MELGALPQRGRTTSSVWAAGYEPWHSTKAASARAFDDQGYYLGPLPLPEVPPMQTRTADGQFATRSTAAWPPRLCQWLAQLLVQTVPASGAATPAGRGDEATRYVSDEKISYHICKRTPWQLCSGPAPSLP